MSADFDSDLQRGLESLSSDAGHIGLPGPAAARRRARQRTRNQATGAVLGAVAIVASGVFAFAQPTLSSAPDYAGPPPSESATPTESATPSDTPTPTHDVPGITPDALLRAADLSPILDSDWQESGPLPDADLGVCSDALPGGELTRWFVPTAQEASHRWNGAFQVIEPHTDETATTAAYAALRDTYEQCAAAKEQAQFHDSYTVGAVGDEAYAIVMGVPAEADFGRELAIGVARSGTVVTRVIRQVAVQETGPPELIVADLATAVNRICTTPAGGACAGEPEIDRIPQNTTGTPGYLSPDDAARVLGTPGVWEVALEPTDVGDGGHRHVCAVFDDVPGMEATQYTLVTLDAGVPEPARSVTQSVLTFPDEESAISAADQMTAGFDACGQAQPQLEVSPVTDQVWLVGISDSVDPPPWWGLARRGSVVTLVEIRVPEADGVTDEDAVSLVDLAGERLADLE